MNAMKTCLPGVTYALKNSPVQTLTKTGVFSSITVLFHVLHALFSITFRNYFQVFDEVFIL